MHDKATYQHNTLAATVRHVAVQRLRLNASTCCSHCKRCRHDHLLDLVKHLGADDRHKHWHIHGARYVLLSKVLWGPDVNKNSALVSQGLRLQPRYSDYELQQAPVFILV